MQERADVAVIRLGLVSAGSVAQAIHIPTVARLGGDVCVTEVMDVDPELARVVAGPHGARATSTLEEMLAAASISSRVEVARAPCGPATTRASSGSTSMTSVTQTSPPSRATVGMWIA